MAKCWMARWSEKGQNISYLKVWSDVAPQGWGWRIEMKKKTKNSIINQKCNHYPSSPHFSFLIWLNILEYHCLTHFHFLRFLFMIFSHLPHIGLRNPKAKYKTLIHIYYPSRTHANAMRWWYINVYICEKYK